MKNRIILSGVHGVGKGYFLDNKVRNNYDVIIMSASDIISKYCKPDDGQKRVNNVNSNQNFLLDCLKEVIFELNVPFILDGHLVLLNKQNKLERIPSCFFKEYYFDTIFLLQDEPKNIYQRLYNRDGTYKLDIKTINKIQIEELKYARELEKSGVNVVYLNPNSACGLYDIYLT